MMDPKNPLTPGVYNSETGAFPNAIVQVATAVPVFIGYTRKASYNGMNLSLQPIEVDSMNDLINFFGGAPAYHITALAPATGIAPAYHFELTTGSQQSPFVISSVSQRFYLFNSMQLFFANGGGKCYIISAGPYAAADGTVTTPNLPDLQSALGRAASQADITLIIIPDALLLNADDYASLTQSMLMACYDAQGRFAIFDIPGGDTFADTTLPAAASEVPAPVAAFRDGIGENYLNYGAA